MLGQIVSMTCYLYFFIIISVTNVPFSVVLTFLSVNIPVLSSLWFVHQPDQDVSHVFITNLAILTNLYPNCSVISQATCDLHDIFDKGLLTESRQIL